MNSRLRLLLGGVAPCLLFALWSCGTTGDSNPGTSTSGPVSISTNHTMYQPGDVIRVSVTNNIQKSIFAYDTRASCTILGLQVQVNGIWQNSQASRCALGGSATLVEIPAGKTYSATIGAGTPGVSSPGFPTGSYRFELKYSTSPTGVPQHSKQGTTTIYSAAFIVTDG
jgi:hypothetical protein